MTRTVPKSDPVGYYSYNVCMNVMYLKVDGTSEGTLKFYAPKSEPYRAIVYSKTGNYKDAKKDY